MNQARSTLDERLAAESDRSYKINPATIWVGVIGGVTGLLLFLSFGVVAGRQDAFISRPMILGLLIAAGSIALLLHALKLYGQTLEITADGVAVHDRRGNELGSLRWIELDRVTERPRMAQLALWDKSGARRVLVEHQFENYRLIRARILSEYERVFTPRLLPLELKGANAPLLEPFLFALGIAFFSWCAWTAFAQHHPLLTLFFLGLVLSCFLGALSLYPHLRGPSQLLEDRLMLRRLFRTEELRKKDVARVQIGDLGNPRSAVKFSVIVLETTGGAHLEINSRYGSIPELYLTLQAWLRKP